MKIRPNNWQYAVAGALATVAISGSVYGQAPDALIDKLVEKGYLTVKEANELRQEADKATNQTFSVKSGLPEWINSLKFNGDVRLRYDAINLPDNQAPAGSALAVDRNRFRYRLRFGATAVLKDDFEVGFRLISGEPTPNGPAANTTFGGTPVSGNTTFTGNGAKKFIYVDLAYAKWNPLHNDDWSLTLTGGKMENPFVFSDIVFDPDYTPEGAAFNLVRHLGKKHAIKLNGGAFAINEISAASQDVYLYGGQLRLDSKWNPKLQSSLGIALLGFSGRSKTGANLATAAVPNQNYGNTRDAAGNLVYNYNPIVADAALTYTLDSFPLYRAPFPIKVFGDYMNNPAVAKENYAWTAGVAFGKSGKKGLWDLTYRYKYLGADAWFEELVDDDTGGFYGLAPLGGAAGFRAGTNVRGHWIKATYSPTDAMTIGLAYFATDLINSYGNPAASRQSSDAGRFLFDISWKF